MINCSSHQLKFEHFLTRLFAFHTALAQIDLASIINYFGDRNINANWLKQQGNILTDKRKSK